MPVILKDFNGKGSIRITMSPEAVYKQALEEMQFKLQQIEEDEGFRIITKQKIDTE